MKIPEMPEWAMVPFLVLGSLSIIFLATWGQDHMPMLGVGAGILVIMLLAAWFVWSLADEQEQGMLATVWGIALLIVVVVFLGMLLARM